MYGKSICKKKLDHAAIHAFRTRKVWPTLSWKEGYLMPECNLNTPLLQGAGHVTFEATSTVRDCEHLFIVTLVHLCILGKRERRFIRDGYHWKTWEGAFKSMLANQKFNGWPFLSSFPSKEMRSYPLPLDAFESVPNLKKTLGIVAFVVSVKSIDSTNAQIKQLIVLRLFKIN